VLSSSISFKILISMIDATKDLAVMQSVKWLKEGVDEQ